MRSYEDSLQRLGVDHIDILFIHDVDIFTHGHDVQPRMQRAAMEGAYKASTSPPSGDIKAISLGVNEAKPTPALEHGQLMLPSRRLPLLPSRIL